MDLIRAKPIHEEVSSEAVLEFNFIKNYESFRPTQTGVSRLPRYHIISGWEVLKKVHSGYRIIGLLSFLLYSGSMSNLVNQILAKPILLADRVSAAVEELNSFKQECEVIKIKTRKLGMLLRQAARASNSLYERPTRRIIDETEQVLEKALALVLKCRGNGLAKRIFTLIIPAAAFRKIASLLDNSVGDVTWLLRVSTSTVDKIDDYMGLPPIAANEPILCLIWEHIAILCTGSLDDRSDAAASLVSLAQDNDRYGKLIIEEGAVTPLLKLVKETKVEGQENAARAIGLLARDPESVEIMLHAGVCTVFEKILKEGPMKVQAVVAWALSELATHYSKCKDLFAQHNIIRMLVGHLAFETLREHSKYAIVSKITSIDKVVFASNNNNNSQQYQLHNLVATVKKKANGNVNVKENIVNYPHQHKNLSLLGVHCKGRELEDPATKAYMKAMAARALWKLARGSSSVCRSITESSALLCFAVLLEKGSEEVQFNSAMALTEIIAVAEQDTDLRRSAFKPNSPACKAVIDQLLILIKKSDTSLLIPCIRSIGNLSRTFRATETRMIIPLVKLLDEQESVVYLESCLALTKFVCTDNYLHLDHSKTILGSEGAKHLVHLVYFGELMVQLSALILLSYISLHVPESEELAKAEVLTVLGWASKQVNFNQEGKIKTLLADAKGRLELYHSRGVGTKGYFLFI